MGLEASPLQPSLLPRVTQLINRHMRLVPPGWELTEPQVERVIAQAGSLWRHHYPDEEHRELETFCVLASGWPVAAAQIAYFTAGSSTDEPTASLEWAVADPEGKEAAGALLDQIIAGAKARGCLTISASGRWAFGLGWIGVPVVQGGTRVGDHDGRGRGPCGAGRGDNTR